MRHDTPPTDPAADWQIKTPAQLQFLGPSQSGKSTRILQLLAQQQALFDRPFKKLVYAAPGLQSASDNAEDGGELDTAVHVKEKAFLNSLRAAAAEGGFQEVYITATLPSVADICESDTAPTPTLLVLDDLLCFDTLTSLTELSSLYAHHRDISCIYCLQNPFQKTSKVDLTTLSRNVTGFFLFFQTADWRLYGTLNARLFPDRPGFLTDCLLTAHKLGLNYIFVNTASFLSLPRRHICYTALFSQDAKAASGERPLFFDLQNPPTLSSHDSASAASPPNVAVGVKHVLLHRLSLRANQSASCQTNAAAPLLPPCDQRRRQKKKKKKEKPAPQHRADADGESARQDQNPPALL